MPANIGPQLTTGSGATKLTWHFQTLLNSAVCLWCLPTHMPVKQHLSPSGYLLMSTMFWLYHYCTLFIINPKAKADVRSTTATPLHYRKLVLCRVPEAHGKPQNTHGKGFAVCRTWQRAHGKQPSAKARFAVCYICRAHGKGFAVCPS